MNRSKNNELQMIQGMLASKDKKINELEQRIKDVTTEF